MANQKYYKAIVRAIKDGRLVEPFRAADVKKACPDLLKKTISTFLPKHEIDYKKGYSTFFRRISYGKYKVVKPYKYNA